MKELKLEARFIEADFRSADRNLTICNRQLRRHVALPPTCTAIVVVFSKRPMPECFRLEEADRWQARVDGSPNTSFYFHTNLFLMEMMKAGYRYVRVEYTP